MSKINRIENVAVIRELLVSKGSHKGDIKSTLSFNYPTLQASKSYHSLEKVTRKSYKYGLSIDHKFAYDIAPYFENGGYKALLSTDDTVQYHLYNFISNMVLYIRKHRIAFANAPKLEVVEQDLSDVQGDCYTRLRSALTEYANDNKEDINTELTKRFRRVIFKDNSDVLETMTKEEKQLLVMTKATAMLESFNLDSFDDFKYVTACIVGQIYDAYLMRSGRELAYATTDIVCSELDGAELNTIGAIFAKKALQFARDLENDTDTINIMNMNIKKVDIYFENNESDLSKFNEIKENAMTKFNNQDDKTVIRLNKLVSDSEKRFLYRLRDRINLFYNDIETNGVTEEETKATARRLTRREQYASKQRQLAQRKAVQFLQLVKEYRGEVLIDELMTSELSLLQRDIRQAHNKRRFIKMTSRENVTVTREATAETEAVNVGTKSINESYKAHCEAYAQWLESKQA